MRLEVLLRWRNRARWWRRWEGRDRKRDRAKRVRRPLLRQAMALKLDIEPVAENRLESFEPRARASSALPSASARSIGPSEPAGQRNQTLRHALPSIGDGRDHLAGLGRSEIGVGREPHQIGVACRVLGEQRDAPVGARPLKLAGMAVSVSGGEGERQREPDDRLDAGLGQASRENSSAPNRLLESVSASAGAVGAGQRGELRRWSAPLRAANRPNAREDARRARSDRWFAPSPQESPPGGFGTSGDPPPVRIVHTHFIVSFFFCST